MSRKGSFKEGLSRREKTEAERFPKAVKLWHLLPMLV